MKRDFFRDTRAGKSFLQAAPLALFLLCISIAVPVAGLQNPNARETARREQLQPASWSEVDRLVSEQKFEEAAKTVERLRLAAREAGEASDWTRALIRETQLRMGLHGFERAVRFLKEQPWPEGTLNRAPLELFYAGALVQYYRAYSWEVSRREKVQSAETVDLRAWTRDQIYTEAQESYQEVWAQREALGGAPIDRLEEYLNRNNYPSGIRDTLRDTASYLYVELLADSSLWSPEHSNELYRLDLNALVAGGMAKGRSEAVLADPAAHPLTKIDRLLDDLETWHREHGRRGAVLEVRLERARRLHSAFTDSKDRALIVEDLERRLQPYRDESWWAEGMATLAGLIRQGNEPGRLVRARDLAEQGRKAFPDTIGGRRCAEIVQAIEAPEFRLTSMRADGFGRRSIQVDHRNLAVLHFRAYAVDLEHRLATAKDYHLGLNVQEQQALVKSKKADAQWNVKLPPTPDYEEHRTFVTPPIKKPGHYVVVASMRPDFSSEPVNRIASVELTLSELVLVSTREGGSRLEVRTLSGTHGRPMSGVNVGLYQYDYQRGHRRLEERVSDRNGLVQFFHTPDRENPQHFLFARKGPQMALDPSYYGFYLDPKPGVRIASLLYTDRSVYRPLQKLLWKVVLYNGEGEKGEFRTLPSTPVTVTLVDPNNQNVEEKTVTTNDFGSAAGEFTIPAGRLLGQWYVRSSAQGQAPVRVEEYKRPTFEVSLKDPESQLRLNRPAVLTGQVRYYFGLPVVNGSVKWRVRREPVYPWWWYWRSDAPAAGVQTVAHGTSALTEDGTFAVSFTPEADERLAGASREITYRYHILADATDEGGETRSASRFFRLGFVSVEARFETETGFFQERQPGALKIVRTDLDGVPRKGKGSWRLVALRQPSSTPLPADLPVHAPRGDGAHARAYRTPGDALRPRWESGYAYQAVPHGWSEDAEMGRGEIEHDEAGRATVGLPALPGGAYRLSYETTDDFGAVYPAAKELIVAGPKTLLALPAVLIPEKNSYAVGETARLLVTSGLADQLLFFEIYRNGRRIDRREIVAGRNEALIELPVREEDRGNFGVRLWALRDYQLVRIDGAVFVPWDDKKLALEFASFRDRLRPGDRETWRVTVKSPSGEDVEKGAAEIVAYMYDRSLDIFGAHAVPDVRQIYPYRGSLPVMNASLGQVSSQALFLSGFPTLTQLFGDRLESLSRYGVGGPGSRFGTLGGIQRESVMVVDFAVGVAGGVVGGVPGGVSTARPMSGRGMGMAKLGAPPPGKPVPETAVALRSDFAETAFWQPQLRTGADGAAVIEFTVPDSVTAWNVWVHAVTRDLRGGSLHENARSVKELMVRPYLPRFLREGDRAELKVVVNNASERPMEGTVTLDLLNPETQQSVLETFGLTRAVASKPFTVAAGGGTNVSFPLKAPERIGPAAFKVTARSGDLSDGELRPLPVLPGRMHLVQSRFVTLKNKDRRELTFDDLKTTTDSSRVTERMVVTVEAQLFYSVLSALPYLVNYPYECTEQTLNRFLSTGILSSLYDRYPAVSRMAQQLARRETPLEIWDAVDPNRKMALEESPWLVEAAGGTDEGRGMANVLDPRIARAERESALAKLQKAQTAIGGFPWWPGGPPSPYMTLYLLYGFAKAAEFGIEAPKEMVQRGWSYVALHFREEYAGKMLERDCCWEFLTFLNYVASSYPDLSWVGDALTPQERQAILDHSFKHWREHSPYLKLQLALTLLRMDRPQDASLIFASVMDSAQTTPDEGTFWAPEERAWLWYNDTIETHAFALRTLMEITPNEPRKDGLVQWLFLNKKLNHWKSTRATAEVIYSLVHYLKQAGSLGAREDATVRVGGRTVPYVFEPDRYAGKKNQTVIPGEQLGPEDATVTVEKESPGLVFASASWHYSTEKLPEEESGGLLSVSRRYFKRAPSASGYSLQPLAEGTPISPGDEVEVQLSIRAKHPCEYVHLRDPRAAGLEPENAASRYKWDLGIGWYEETRDSGTNFFFERLPQGEHTFRYRLRASMAGTFKVGPATLQSMYAPEFSAYSSGAVLSVK